MNAMMGGRSQVSERFRQTLDSVHMLVSVSDAEKRGVYFNTRWRAFTGRSLRELLGQGWIEDVHPEDRRRCIEIFEQTCTAREKFSLEYRLRRHDGEYHYVLDACAPEFSDEGVLLGYVSTAIDVNSQKFHQTTFRPAEMTSGAVLDGTASNVPWQGDLMVNSIKAMPDTSVANRKLTIHPNVGDKEAVTFLARDCYSGVRSARLDPDRAAFYDQG